MHDLWAEGQGWHVIPPLGALFLAMRRFGPASCRRGQTGSPSLQHSGTQTQRISKTLSERWLPVLDNVASRTPQPIELTSGFTGRLGGCQGGAAGDAGLSAVVQPHGSPSGQVEGESAAVAVQQGSMMMMGPAMLLVVSSEFIHAIMP